MEGSGSLVLVTGATGYIGGRLVPRLLASGYRVRCLVRDPSRLEGRRWRDQVEIVAGDVLDSTSLDSAMEGVDTAFYLVHSMGAGHSFHERDLVGARNFSRALHAAGGRRIIYLGGLGNSEGALSAHLRSRQATGDALRESGISVTEFRAAVIVGSGSLSFEIIRYLTERVPLLICPRWVFSRIQPISTRNVLEYLVAALRTPASAGEVIEIGGSDVVTYAEMMLGYARARGLRRRVFPVPVLTPRLSSGWVHLVTPIPKAIAQPLIEGLRNEVILHSDRARTLFPDVVPMDYAASVALALERVDAGRVETKWSDAAGTSTDEAVPVQLSSREGLELEVRQQVVNAPPSAVFAVVSALGGDTGWYVMNWAWRLRGWMDRLMGGVGLRRGRRHPTELRAGDALDFWRVERVETDRLVRLRAEMKVPGRAWLEFTMVPHEDGGTFLTQTALFAPRGLAGHLYWQSIAPVHERVFGGLIRAIASRAEAAQTQSAGDGLVRAATT